jgi:hypothetical protein
VCACLNVQSLDCLGFFVALSYFVVVAIVASFLQATLVTWRRATNQNSS